jgi:hypothetical protein
VAALGLAVIVFGIGLAFQVSSRFGVDLDAALGFEVGLLLAIVTIKRPWWFWNHPKATFLRDIVGDTATIIVYLAIAAAFMFISVRRQVTIARTRADCESALADVTDVHARLRILYHAGAVGIPSVSRDEPHALSCARLLEHR